MNLNTKLPWPESWRLAKVYLSPDSGKWHFSLSEGCLSGLNGQGDGPNLTLPSPLLLTVKYPVGSCLHELDVYNICCSYGNVRTHTLLEEKEHGPEHRGVFSVGNKKKSVEGAPTVEAGYRLGTLPTWRGWRLSPYVSPWYAPGHPVRLLP